MFGAIRGTNGRRHEVDFGDGAVEVEAAMSDNTLQITMTATSDLNPNKRRFLTVTLPREQLMAALADAASRSVKRRGGPELRLVDD